MSTNDIQSIDSPSGGGINIKGNIPNVARLSGKAKVFLVTTAGIIMGGITIGVLTAGNHSTKEVEAMAATSMDAVGSIEPPTAPEPKEMELIEEVSPAEGQLMANGGVNLGQPADAPTPRSQFLEWKERHKYDRMKGLILASEAALTSETSKMTAGFSLPKMPSKKAEDDQYSVNDGGSTNANSSTDRAIERLIAMQEREVRASGNRNPQLGFANDANPTAANAEGRVQNKDFVTQMRASAEDGYLPEVKKPSYAETSLFAGSVIPAVMVTGINSDLPGSVSAQVRQTVYDSRDENKVLIPQGTRLVGEYSSDVGYGQKRVLVAWNHLIFPDGSTINLKGMLGGDGQGVSGFHDKVDNHYIRTFGSAILMSLLNVGVQVSQPQNSGALNTSTASSQAAAAAASSLSESSSRVLNKNLGIQPTLEIRPGYSFNVLVNRTMIMPEYLGEI